MNVRTPGRVAAALLLVVLPVVCIGSPRITPDFYQNYSVYRGFYDNQAAWFICTSASSISFADSTFFATVWNPWFPTTPDLAPRLLGALSGNPRAARPMYLVVNSGQGPVFDTRPGSDDYSGLWQVFLIKFKPGFTRPVTNTSPSDPQGLPTPSEGEVIETNNVLDCPIIALGSLDSSEPDGYMTRQAAYWSLDGAPKSVMLPIYCVYTSNPLTGRPGMAGVLVTDAQTQELAELFQANLAPGLSAFPNASANNLWRLTPPCPSGQLPVVQSEPIWQTRSYNPLYCPVLRYYELGRHMPAYTTVSNPCLLQKYLTAGLLFEVSGGQQVNGSVVPVN